jgi:hypothetical protein
MYVIITFGDQLVLNLLVHKISNLYFKHAYDKVLNLLSLRCEIFLIK